MINSFGENYAALHTLKTIDGKFASNIYHNNYLRIFCPLERYLRPTNKEPLKVMQNLCFKRRKDWSVWDLVFLYIAVILPYSISLHIVSITIEWGANASNISLDFAKGSRLIRREVVEEEKKK